MTVGDWVGIIEALALIYLAWQQNQIFKKQNEIFATQAGIEMPIKEVRVQKLKLYWPMLAMALIMIFTWVAIALDYHDRHSYLPVHFKMKSDQEQVVYAKSYRNESLEIDGKKFDHCKFDNVTFMYRGLAPVDFVTCDFTGNIYLRTNNDAAKAVMMLAQQLAVISTSHGGKLFISTIDENGNLVPVPSPLPAGNPPSGEGGDTSTAVFMECARVGLPLTIPHGQKLRIVPLSKKRLKEHNSSFYEVLGDARKETQWPNKQLIAKSNVLHNPGALGYACTVSNHGEKNLLYVSVPIDINVDNEKPAIRLSPVIGALDVGARAQFYIFNDCNEMVSAVWQDTARVQILGEASPRDVPLRRSFSNPVEQIMIFFPSKLTWASEYGKTSCE